MTNLKFRSYIPVRLNIRNPALTIISINTLIKSSDSVYFKKQPRNIPKKSLLNPYFLIILLFRADE
jgi:hypothetical protein